MPQITIDDLDAVELAELLGYLSEWLTADRAVLEASLGRFVGQPGYDLHQLRDDLARFVFLLGHTDGEGLFTPDP
jgi:hypothetical protein